jgi:hypothetical protein
MRTTEVVFSNGLIASCNLSSGHPERFYGYYGSDIESSFVGDVNISIYHNGVGVEICNFTEKALSWNLKNLYRANGSIKYEGEVEIMISGVIYAEHVILENYPFLVLKYLELTSLTKLSVTTENN